VRTAIIVLVLVCFLESAAFVGLYSRSAWSSTAMGRHLMSLGAVLTVLFGMVLAGWLVGPLPRILWVAGLGALAGVLGWRIQLLLRAQRRD
jgi:hypothetical protein